MDTIEKEELYEYISSLVLEGYIAGFDPEWKLVFLEVSHSDLSDIELSHIAKQIKEGFVNGEVQEDDKQGWWFLKIKRSSVRNNAPDWQFMEDYIKSLAYSNNI